jgi:hypothetical protein
LEVNLVKDENIMAIIGNKDFERYINLTHVPRDLFIKLATDQSIEVRQHVARDEEIPADILEAMSYDDAPSVRVSVVRNPTCPLHVLNRLVDDSSPAVTREVRRIINRVMSEARRVNAFHDRLNVIQRDSKFNQRLEAIQRKR